MAAELGIVYVDTGAIYRSIGCYMHDHQIDPHDAQAWRDLAETLRAVVDEVGDCSPGVLDVLETIEIYGG